MNTTEFVYLGSLLMEENDGSKEIHRRIARATGAMEQIGKIWRSKISSTGTKMNIIKAMVMSVAMYASKTWALKKQDRDRLLASEMKR